MQPSSTFEPPISMVNLQAAQARFGVDRVNLLIEMCHTGDPLADRVIQELDRLGPAGHPLLKKGLHEGLEALSDPPVALKAFLQEAEHLPDWLDQERLKRGSESFISIGETWVIFSLGPGSLTHTYSSPTVAKVLVKTGNLTQMARRRLAETSTWNYESLYPGGLLRGAKGYVHNLQVRLLHARVRTTLQKRGWDSKVSGTPINQLEMLRTWMDFTVVPFNALQKLGIVFTRRELDDLYHYWQYIAYLLGIDPRLYRSLTGQQEAQQWLDLLDLLTGPPTEDSRQLTRAMLDTVAEALERTIPLPRPFLLDLAHAMTRRLHGDRLSDQLGIKHTWVSLLMPLLSGMNRVRRMWENRSPTSRKKALDAALMGLHNMTAKEGPTTYQTHAEGPAEGLPKTAEP